MFEKIAIILRQTGDYGVYGYGDEGREMIGEPCKTVDLAEDALRQAASDSMLDVVRNENGDLRAE